METIPSLFCHSRTVYLSLSLSSLLSHLLTDWILPEDSFRVPLFYTKLSPSSGWGCSRATGTKPDTPQHRKLSGSTNSTFQSAMNLVASIDPYTENSSWHCKLKMSLVKYHIQMYSGIMMVQGHSCADLCYVQPHEGWWRGTQACNAVQWSCSANVCCYYDQDQIAGMPMCPDTPGDSPPDAERLCVIRGWCIGVQTEHAV